MDEWTVIVTAERTYVLPTAGVRVRHRQGQLEAELPVVGLDGHLRPTWTTFEHRREFSTLKDACAWAGELQRHPV